MQPARASDWLGAMEICHMRLALFLALMTTPALAQDAEEGAAAFFNHCAGCHGQAAAGDGPMASLLAVPPADLTGLAERNGGDFPLKRVAQRIDGTTEVRAHGGPMPVFGLLLDGPTVVIAAPDGSDVTLPEGIANIVAWLMEVQR
ncbi:MAG: cytochrome c [Silicimonas sp.]|nr:cytochrome c [Silicimonas sp.]